MQDKNHCNNKLDLTGKMENSHEESGIGSEKLDISHTGDTGLDTTCEYSLSLMGIKKDDSGLGIDGEKSPSSLKDASVTSDLDMEECGCDTQTDSGAISRASSVSETSSKSKESQSKQDSNANRHNKSVREIDKTSSEMDNLSDSVEISKDSVEISKDSVEIFVDKYSGDDKQSDENNKHSTDLDASHKHSVDHDQDMKPADDTDAKSFQTCDNEHDKNDSDPVMKCNSEYTCDKTESKEGLCPADVIDGMPNSIDTEDSDPIGSYDVAMATIDDEEETQSELTKIKKNFRLKGKRRFRVARIKSDSETDSDDDPTERAQAKDAKVDDDEDDCDFDSDDFSDDEETEEKKSKENKSESESEAEEENRAERRPRHTWKALYDLRSREYGDSNR